MFFKFFRFFRFSLCFFWFHLKEPIIPWGIKGTTSWNLLFLRFEWVQSEKCSWVTCYCCEGEVSPVVLLVHQGRSVGQIGRDAPRDAVVLIFADMLWTLSGGIHDRSIGGAKHMFTEASRTTCAMKTTSHHQGLELIQTCGRIRSMSWNLFKPEE